MENMEESIGRIEAAFERMETIMVRSENRAKETNVMLRKILDRIEVNCNSNETRYSYLNTRNNISAPFLFMF